MPPRCLNWLGLNQPVTKPSCAHSYHVAQTKKNYGKSEPTPGLDNPMGKNICVHHQSTDGCAHEDSHGKLSCDGTFCVNQLPAAREGPIV